MSASAQEVLSEMPVPSLSETERAEPDWFQQFTISPSQIESPSWQTAPTKTLRLAWAKGDRWSVKVDMMSRETNALMDLNPLPREEMLAGADFRITPRISIGGELSLGADELDDSARWQEQQVEAGIRLRSAFKF
ncbi:MAG: NtrZ family periplasmic regulatory protein [Pseudomonadota bacterium]